MSHYVCGRQFIFEEEPQLIFLGLLAVMAVGMLIGLLLGLVIGIAGIFIFEMALLGLALFILYDAYDLTFVKKSGAQDKTGFAFMVMFCSCLVMVFMALMRYSAFALSTSSRCLVFSGIGVALASTAYVYARLCCQEDQRKHHLGPCGADGEPLEMPKRQASPVRSFGSFVSWICSGECFFEINDWLVPDKDLLPKDQIHVHNQSLKLIKVCFYSSRDVVCWVPAGGIAGSCVGFIRSAEKRSFTLPRPRGQRPGSEEFRLKVFMPGLLDKELACSMAQRGQSFAFIDVEGVVRRSRLLSSQEKSNPGPTLPIESSEDEYAAASALMKDRKFDLPQPAGSLRKRASGCIHEEGLTSSPAQSSSSRKAAPDEIVVRNRSSEDVRALLFRADDYCYMVPVVGKLLACGDCILQGEERRFNPSADDLDEFTLKVYSVGAAAKELTYLTVRRGNAYTFCDSLLS